MTYQARSDHPSGKYNAKPRHLLKTALGVGACVAMLSACTTIPSSDGFLSDSTSLKPATGVRGKRLATIAPSPPIALGTKLLIEPAVYTADAAISANVTEPERALILNALMRSLCADTSRQFEIVDTSSADGAYRLRSGITRVDATGKVGAAIGNAMGFVVPVVGLRPPIGLGGLTVEFELMDPTGKQAAAMVWARSADMASGTSVSRIGDAYGFSGEASQSFTNLISAPPGAARAAGAIGLSLPGKTDEICAQYGREAGRLAGAFSALALPLPPEMTDKGPVPKE